MTHRATTLLAAHAFDVARTRAVTAQAAMAMIAKQGHAPAWMGDLIWECELKIRQCANDLIDHAAARAGCAP